MNLQLFALKDKTIIMANDGGGSPTKKPATTSSGYDPNSIVDYLKSQGQDSSYSARKQLAQQMGIKDYKGSGTQNTQLLNMLKEGSKPSTPATKVDDKPSKKDKPTVADPVVKEPVAEAPALAVPETPVFTQSEEVTNANALRDNALSNLTSMSAPSVSAETMQMLNTPFTASSAYLEAMKYTNSLLEKLSSGKTSYTDQIKDMMSQIQNRDKFSYDVDTDMLFQQALASSMASGQQAMQDTMGQTSALTGGYASTYAQSAGNQAYNAYIEDAYNNLPEYYQMALEAYNMEGQDMYNQLAMLSDADATEYGRMYDSWNANFTNAQNMFNQEYGAWQDSVNNAYNSANLQLKQQGMAYDQAYSNYNALSNQAQTLYQNEYNKWADSVNIALDNYWKGVDNQYRYDSMANDNYWNEKDDTYRYDVMENNNEQAQIDRDQKYNMWLAENDLNGDGAVNDKDYAVSKSYSSSNTSDSGMTTLTNRELDTFVNTVLSAESEEEGFKAGSDYLASIGKSETDFAELDFALEEARKKREKEEAEAYEKLPAWEKNWTIVDDTYNGGFLGTPLWSGADHNDTFTDGTNTYTYDQLKKMLEDSNLSKEQKKAFLDKLTAQSKN